MTNISIVTRNSSQKVIYVVVIDYDQSIMLRLQNLSTYTPIKNCYTPLTGSRPKSQRQSVNKHSNWVKPKGGN